MKKFLLVIMLLSFTVISLSAEFEGNFVEGDTLIGIGLPTYGWAVKNDEGAITGYNGINLALGYSSRHYFEPLEYNQWNPYWHWGTVALLVPYIGIGADYQTNGGFYIGVGTIYIAPYIEFGVKF